MKIKWGALAVDGRGKIGGHVASKNRAGAYLRTKVTPVNTFTERRQFVRSVFASVSRQWGGLTREQQQSFNERVSDYMRSDIFGDSREMSGKNLHQSLNTNLLNVQLPILETLGAKARLGEIHSIDTTIAVSASALVVSFDAVGLFEATGGIIVRACQGYTSAKKPAKNTFKQLFSAPIADPSDALIDPLFQDSYVSVFGLPSVGEKIDIEFILVSTTGEASVPFVTTAIVTEVP